MDSLDWTLVEAGVIVSLTLMFMGLAVIASVTPARRPHSAYLFGFVVLGSLGAAISIAQFVRRESVPSDQLQSLQRQLNELSKTASDTKQGIETLRTSPLTRKGPTPKTPEAAAAPSAEPHPANSGASAPAAQPLRITTRQVDPAGGAALFALELIVLADVTIASPSFKIECDGPIDDAKFVVAGAPAVSGGRTVQTGNNVFLSFGSPAVQPDTPVVVTLSSRTKISVTRVTQAPF